MFSAFSPSRGLLRDCEIFAGLRFKLSAAAVTGCEPRPECWQPPHHQHQLAPHQEHAHRRRVVLPPRHQRRELRSQPQLSSANTDQSEASIVYHLVEAVQRVVVEADHDDVDDDAPLDPVLPVEEVELLAVHQLEHLLGGQHQGRHDQQHPHHDRAPGDPEYITT